MSLGNVAVLVLDSVRPFELAIFCGIFGIDRAPTPTSWLGGTRR